MKKKTYIITLVFLLILAVFVIAVLLDVVLAPRRSVAIIGGADGPTAVIVAKDEKTTKEEQINIDMQLEIIAQNRDSWAADLEYANEIYKYAVADLDRNGRLEIIVSDHGGTGQYTYSRFFEVTENFDGLKECETDFMEGDSQPDIIFETQLKTYIDENGGFHYVLRDSLKNGAAEYYENYRALMLKDGKIKTAPIAYKSVLYDPQNVSCTDADGNEISMEDYDSAPDTYFTGYQETVTYLGWQDVYTLPIESEKIIALLKESMMIFAAGSVL